MKLHLKLTPQALIWAAVLLFLASAVSTESTTESPTSTTKAPEDETSSQDEESSESSDDSSKSAFSNTTELEGSSRTTGGELGTLAQEAPDWLVLAWANKLSHKDGLIAGLGIRVAGRVILMHERSLNTVLREDQSDLNKMYFDFPVPKSINITRIGNVNEVKRRFNIDEVRHIAHIDREFELFRLTHKFIQEPFLGFRNKLLIDYKPGPHKDCYMYAYGVAKQKTTDYSTDKVRSYNRIKVEIGTCECGLCQIRPVPPGQVCNGLAELGAPIMCGSPQQLAYINAGMPYRPGCGGYTMGLKMSKIEAEIKKYSNIQNPDGTWINPDKLPESN